ncbi:MAG: nucleotidyl transferase AbiEii/AbiGii toxin family protein [Minisyncoccota bacterium]
MTLHSETITDAMAAIAKVIFEVLDEQYYLAGGTALALRLGHRKSVDLDYDRSHNGRYFLASRN